MLSNEENAIPEDLIQYFVTEDPKKDCRNFRNQKMGLRLRDLLGPLDSRTPRKYRVLWIASQLCVLFVGTSTGSEA